MDILTTPMFRSAATNVSKVLVVSVAIVAAVITAVSVHSIYPVEDPITPVGYLDRQVAVHRPRFRNYARRNVVP